MRVFLLRNDDGTPAFFAERPDAADEASEAQGGGRLARAYRRWRRALEDSDRSAARWARGAWSWLQRFVGRDEPMLQRLRGAEVIQLCHPPEFSDEEARDLWEEYLTGRARHHLIWLAVNASISPLTILLAPIPGPNVIGYWFVYRAICHLLAFLGIRRALRERTTTDCRIVEAADVPVEAGGGP